MDARRNRKTTPKIAYGMYTRVACTGRLDSHSTGDSVIYFVIASFFGQQSYVNVSVTHPCFQNALTFTMRPSSLKPRNGAQMKGATIEPVAKAVWKACIADALRSFQIRTRRICDPGVETVF